MKFQDSQVELRLRTPDEAIDIGVLLARNYWWPLLGGWALIAIPFFAIACLIPNTFWAIVFFWWFKPLYERIPLHIISSSIFQQRHSYRVAVNTVFQLDTLAWLTIFRVCPGRSTLAPVAALEGLQSGTGKIRRRRQLVKSPMINTYFLLHTGMFVCEFVITVMGVILYMKVFKPVFDETMLPIELIGDQWNWVWTSETCRLLILSLIATSFALMAPFYVCAGFGLYINRRIELEGWDLYLGFQRLLSRLGVGCFVLVVLISTIDVEAQHLPEPKFTAENSRVQVGSDLEEIMQDQIVEEVPTRSPKQTGRTPGPVNVGDWMQIVSYVIMGTLAVLIGGFIIWAMVKLRVWEFGTKRRKEGSEEESRVSIFANEHNADDLLPNVVARAQQLWQKGQSREALSILYRGALIYLKVRHSCPIEISDTERRCTRVIAHRAPSLSSVFNEVCSSWQQVAYAKKRLKDKEFHQLLSLYEESFA